ncbi:phenylacetic acid degradation protein PaaN [Streptomyces sp. NPDC000134]|uniref:phenylacetic acid degradation protein PaaN n=1 Tax=Streptomyces sp. NPDC000134 TaxID=3364536 RepID=UPI003697F8BF
MAAALTASTLLAEHRPTLDRALEAIRTRAYWSPHPEHPKAYGEEHGSLDAAAGRAAFDALLGTRLDLGQPGTDDWVGDEVSPYGIELGVRYPHADLDVLLPAMRAGQRAWRDAGPEQRALVCLEILKRISARTHEFAHAVMHTSGQAFLMAFQAGGPHAQDRALEAVAYAYAEQVRVPEAAEWTKPQGKRDPLRLTKRFTPVPRGIALVIGCNTFPTWNGYPGLFASLATGNAVLVKPHPRAVLPLALTVRIAREVLAEAGFDPALVALAAERPGEGIAKTLATRPEIRIIDYTGSTAFGDWLEANARQAQVFTEKAGVNTVVVESTDDYRGMLANLAFSLSLYSGQMCTTPQNLLIPRAGIGTDQGPRSYDEVVADLAGAVDALLGDDTRANALLGAIVNPDVKARLEAAAGLGEVALASRAVPNPDFPGATVRTPLIVRLDGAEPDDRAACLSECFGPVSFAVAVDSAAHALELLRRGIREQGAMTVGAYTTDAEFERAVEEVCLEEAAQLSLNLTGGVYVNQTAAFSDFHGSGGNPAANATLTDAAFVANRFRMIEVRREA